MGRPGYLRITRQSAPRLVAEQLLGKIDTGELNPGDSLPAQRQLAKMLGVGRSSLREAINALAVMGYLEVIQGRGTYICDSLPAADAGLSKLDGALQAGALIDLMEIRETIECRSAQLAAERAGKEEIRRLTKLLEQIDAQRADYDAYLDADLAFHIGVAQAAQNEVTLEITRLLLEKVAAHHRRLQTAHLSSAYRDNSLQSARQVVTCIQNRRGADAAAWMDRHLKEIRSELKDILV
jgi:GntR family transcriptional repressor for pyruvate dehydrogenase complex